MSFFYTDMTQVVEIISRLRARTYLFYIANIMGIDVLTAQGARASVNMIFIVLNLNNSVPAR